MYITTKPRIAIYDSWALYSYGVSSVLQGKELQLFTEFTGVYHDLISLKDMITYDKPELLIYIINKTIDEDIESLYGVKLALPNTKVIAMSVREDYSFVKQVLDVVDIYIPKSTSEVKLVLALRTLITSGVYMNKQMYMVILDRYNPKPSSFFSNKELEIIKLTCEKEYTASKISKILQISPRTVESIKVNLQRKIKAKCFIGVVTYAIRNKFI